MGEIILNDVGGGDGNKKFYIKCKLYFLFDTSLNLFSGLNDLLKGSIEENIHPWSKSCKKHTCRSRWPNEPISLWFEFPFYFYLFDQAILSKA